MRCVFASGGSGGHLFPAVTLAADLKKYNVTLITDERGIKFLPKENSFESVIVHKLRSKNKKGSGSIFRMMISFIKCLFMLKKIKPKFVMGFGGYPSIPCVFAAQVLKIPTILHEQNIVFSKANRLLLKKSKIGFTSFKETVHEKAYHVGNFIRKDIEVLFDEEPINDNVNKLNILVIGGSQGSKVFLEKLPDIFKKVNNSQEKLVIHHQIGNNFAQKGLYDGLDAKVEPFFYDMKKEYRWADLVISRGGSSTIFELALAKKPSILIPMLDGCNNNSHQRENIKALKDSVILVEEEKIEEITYIVDMLLSNRWRLFDMSKKIMQFACIDSSKKAAAVIDELF